jgi:protoporphyrin/coproporphyrin ferrochelatase
MGGPAKLNEVSQFMYNLFNDPHIMGMPRPFRSLLARIITIFRIRNIRKHYALIGGGSPLRKWTVRQAELVSARLQSRFPGLMVKEAYSYSPPSITTAILELVQSDVYGIIALPLYPHYATATLGSIYSDLEEARKKFELGNCLRITHPFFDNPGYIALCSEFLKEALAKIDVSKPYHVIFSAHALPQSFIDKGDPYRQQVERTVELILKQVPLEGYSLSFQSKIGPVTWMKPSTIETVKEIGHRNIRQVIIMPIGFVCDHIETLYELDIELAGYAKDADIEKFIRAAVPNDHEAFIEMLASLIAEAMK